jgi:hypothetical protein
MKLVFTLMALKSFTTSASRAPLCFLDKSTNDRSIPGAKFQKPEESKEDAMMMTTTTTMMMMTTLMIMMTTMID